MLCRWAIEPAGSLDIREGQMRKKAVIAIAWVVFWLSFFFSESHLWAIPWVALTAICARDLAERP
jgi:hypothetical protein